MDSLFPEHLILISASNMILSWPCAKRLLNMALHMGASHYELNYALSVCPLLAASHQKAKQAENRQMQNGFPWKHFLPADGKKLKPFRF